MCNHLVLILVVTDITTESTLLLYELQSEQ